MAHWFERFAVIPCHVDDDPHTGRAHVPELIQTRTTRRRRQRGVHLESPAYPGVGSAMASVSTFRPDAMRLQKGHRPSPLAPTGAASRTSAWPRQIRRLRLRRRTMSFF